jgi:hypothetical protein
MTMTQVVKLMLNADQGVLYIMHILSLIWQPAWFITSWGGKALQRPIVYPGLSAWTEDYR